MTSLDHQSTTRQTILKRNHDNLARQIDLRTKQLLEANQQLTREIGERKRAEQIARTLFRISNAISTTKDLKDLYASIHRILGEIIDLRNFYIAIYHKQKRRISFPYFIDQFDTDTVYSDQFSEENSLTGEVILAQKPVFLNQSDLDFRAAEKRIIGTAPKIWLGVPLQIKGEVIGVMATQSYQDPQDFDEMDLDILHSVSDQVALAIERKRSEQAMVASEKKYRNIIESIDDGYYEIDLAGNLTLVNQAMCTMLGYSEKELLGMNTADYISAPLVRKINKRLTTVLNAGKPGKTLELELHLKDGKTRYVETVVSSIRDDEDSPIGFRGIARNITERKTAEKTREALEDQLQQSQRLESLGTLAGGIAHDFNNLLMGIQGRTALLLNDLATAHPHYASLKNIEQYVESAANLTTRLLGFARGGKYEVQPVDLNGLIEKNLDMFGRTKKEITICTSLQSHLMPVEVDIIQIEQVLLNLLVNAGQAMPDGGVISITTNQHILEATDAKLYGLAPGNYVEITLSDTGHGMSKETMLKIFDPFFTTKATGHGTGLGLAMVYGIILNHAGAISVKSEVNQGTIFTILLPATDKKIAIENKIPLSLEKGSETVLLVDDEPMIIDIGREILSVLGYEVLTASSGQQAIDVYNSRQERVDLFIIDMIMPQMSGSELFDRLKKVGPTVKVLLSSGYSLDGQARKILNRGCDGFIQKPFTISQLSVKIRAILDATIPAIAEC